MLEPVDDAEASRVADLLANLPETGFRVQRPVASLDGDWVIEDGG